MANGGGGSNHRGKIELISEKCQQIPKIPRVVFALPEGLSDPAIIPGTISRNDIKEDYRVKIEGGDLTWEVRPQASDHAFENGKPVIRFDLLAGQDTKGEFTIGDSFLKMLPPDLAAAYVTPAEYEAMFLEKNAGTNTSTTFGKYGLDLSWKNPRDEDVYMGVILGYQLAPGEKLKLENVEGKRVDPVFPFYFYVVAATPSKPDPEDLENNHGETEWSPATLTIDLTQFSFVNHPKFPFGKDPEEWDFYHHALRKDHHISNRFIVNRVPNGQWNSGEPAKPDKSVFTVTIPNVGTQPGLLLGRYFLGIVQP